MIVLQSCCLAVLQSCSAAVQVMSEVEGKGNIKCQSSKSKWNSGMMELTLKVQMSNN
jgi:hypothetical protein